MGRNISNPDDLLTHVVNLERRLTALERSRQLGNSSVDAGTFYIRSEGQLVFSAGDVGGVGSEKGYVFWYPNGGAQMALYGADPLWAVWDQDGNMVLSTDTASNFGLGRPYIPFVPVDTSSVYTPRLTTTDSDFTAVQTIFGFKQHPKVQLMVLVQNPGGTVSESRLSEPGTGNVLSGPTTHADGFYGYIYHTGSIDPGLGFGGLVQLDLEFRRVSGAGTPRLEIMLAYGKQS